MAYLTGNASTNAGIGKSLRFYTSATETLSLVSGTGVGILLSGTAPTTALHVSGTLRIAEGGENCDTNRLGALKYASNQFYICQNTTNGWESLATISSSTTVAINTGLSGSIVFRDETGVLKAYDSFSISSTTGSIGIGAGAPAWLGNNGLYAGGRVSANNLNLWNSTGGIYWLGDYDKIYGNATSHYIALTTSGTEAMRIVSSGYVGIGTTAPNYPLQVNGIIAATNKLYAGSNGYSFSGDTSSFLSNPTTGALALSTANTEALRVVSTGYVGIGTATPTARLDVSGTVSATLVKLANNPLDACTIATIGAIKSINGRIYVCRQ